MAASFLRHGSSKKLVNRCATLALLVYRQVLISLYPTLFVWAADLLGIKAFQSRLGPSGMLRCGPRAVLPQDLDPRPSEAYGRVFEIVASRTTSKYSRWDSGL